MYLTKFSIEININLVTVVQDSLLLTDKTAHCHRYLTTMHDIVLMVSSGYCCHIVTHVIAII